LAKDPEARYRCASDFARDLGDIAAGRWYLIEIADRGTAPPVAAPNPVADRAATAKLNADPPTPHVPRDYTVGDESSLDDTGVFDPDDASGTRRRR
jgi:hypothetical protein